MPSNENPRNPSLLDNEARGGDTAEGGITFQAGVVLTYLPVWLAQDGFTMLLREGLGDVEARFYRPGKGFYKEFVEVKDHSVTPAEFWKEITRFQEIAATNGEYAYFTLAIAGLSDTLHPLLNGLKRSRNPRDFYLNDSVILDQSYRDFVDRVIKLDQDENTATFIYEKVTIQADLSLNRVYSEMLFKQGLRNEFPEFADLPERVIDAIHGDLVTFIQSRRNVPILRRELEERIYSHIPTSLQIPIRPVRLYTNNGKPTVGEDQQALEIDWSLFFSDSSMNYLSADVWNNRLLHNLREIQTWILANRVTRRLRISGDRRLSANLALGWVFSAVAGFTLEMVYRDKIIWSTEAHPRSDTPPYPITLTLEKGTQAPSSLIVIVSILRDISAQVLPNLASYGLEDMPRLHIKNTNALESPEQVNLAVRQIKNQIAAALADTQAQQIDLFLAGPAHFALFLGHRLNGLAPVQCYNWTSPDGYKPTCLLDH